ncbi:MAG: hypothetical protein AB7T59_12205 [Hyphomonadaceae bacterium]
MPNVLSIAPVRALTKRASAKIGNDAVAARFERLAFAQLLRDPRNFRTAKPEELTNAPAWASEARARGEEISVFRVNRALAARLHTLARRLDDTCRIASTEFGVHPSDAGKIESARRFLAKFGRVDFDTAARRALDFSRLFRAWQDDADAAPVCEARTILLFNGRRWLRVTSVRELRAIGREFSNCLARTRSSGGYGGMLMKGHAQFWVLRDRCGNGLVIAMAPGRSPTHFLEVKGRHNAHVRLDDQDLRNLGKAIGIRPSPQPPPPPAAALEPPSRLIAAVLAA